MAQTLSEKVWERHLVRRADGEPDLLYIDMHLVHEVTSPQAFDGLRMAGRGVHRPDLTIAPMDHPAPPSPSGQGPTPPRPRTSTSRWPTPSRPSRSRCWRPTAPSSASSCSRW